MKSLESLEGGPRFPPENRLGKYRLVATLGRGGMADVYLAMLEGPAGFSKLLVVKVLRQEVLEDDTGVQMFLDEARVAARLNHPNIVQTLEVGRDGTRCFLAMEYLEGQSLRRVIRRAGTRNVPIARRTHLRILVDVLGALEYAHSFTEFDGTQLALVHRDVSPQNVILTYEGHVKLIDFGIAKTSLASVETREGIIKGKVKYMPPEQATGQAVDARTDVFAVGVLLWEALVGHGPWHGETDLSIFRSLISGTVPRLSRTTPGLDPRLVAIVDRAVSADPRDRYPTASAMRDELETCVAASPAPPATLRDLPTHLRTLFEDDRRAFRTLVEARLRSPQSAPDPISLTRVRTLTGFEGTQTPSVSRLASLPRTDAAPVPPSRVNPPGARLRLKFGFALGVVAAMVVAATAIVRTRSAILPAATRAANEPNAPASDALASTVAPPPSAPVDLHASPPPARIDASPPGKIAPPATVYVSPRPAAVSAPGPAASLDVSPVPPSRAVTRRPKREVDKEDPYAQ
jgi:serine/threonine-protein kinase